MYIILPQVGGFAVGNNVYLRLSYSPRSRRNVGFCCVSWLETHVAWLLLDGMAFYPFCFGIRGVFFPLSRLLYVAFCRMKETFDDATLRMSVVDDATAQKCWGGVGWGGLITFICMRSPMWLFQHALDSWCYLLLAWSLQDALDATLSAFSWISWNFHGALVLRS